MLKKICAAVITGSMLMTSGIAMAKNLTTYSQIVATLQTGKSVILNINPEQCRVETSDGSQPGIKRLAFKIIDLFEWETTANDGKKMRAFGTQESRLFGNTKFYWSRTLTAVFEDNTVIVFDDMIDPATYNLKEREKITCKLSADNSSGVMVTELGS